MLDIGWQELFIVGILALIVVGPKDLPRAMKTATHWLRKARALAREFQSGIDDIVREAELDDIRKQVQEANPANIGAEIKDSLDPTGDLTKDMDMSDIETGLDEAGGRMKKAEDYMPGADDDPAGELLGEDAPEIDEVAEDVVTAAPDDGGEPPEETKKSSG